MSQAQLAGTDFTKGFISLLETGRARASVRAMEVLAARLSVPIGELLGASGAAKEREVDLLLAERALATGRPAVARALAERLAKSGSPSERARALAVRGRALLDEGRSEDAIGVLRNAVRALRAVDERSLALRALYGLALAHARLGHLGEALALALECERAFRAGDVRDRALELRILTLLSGLHAAHGDFGSAGAVTERARQVAVDVADPLALAHLHAESAVARREQGDLDGALQDARRSLELYEEIGRENLVACAWNNVGWVHIQRREFDRADEAIARAERSAGERGDQAILALARATRAELELARGRTTEAIALAERVAASEQAAARTRGDALLIRAKALAAERAPLVKVRAAFRDAIAALKPEPPLVRADAHQAFADALAARGELADAFEEARRALKASGPTRLHPRSAAEVS